MGIETLQHPTVNADIGHNLLAIWVLKHKKLKKTIDKLKTQPTRYMGIETLVN